MRTQVGNGPMEVFRGYRSHYGAGLGNVLSGILRHAVPLVAPAVKNIGKTLISAGTNRIQNLIEDKLGPATTIYDEPPQARRRRRPVKRKATRAHRTVKRKRRSKADILGP